MKKSVVCLCLITVLAIWCSCLTRAEKIPVATTPPKDEIHPANVTVVDVSKEAKDVEKFITAGKVTIVDVFSEACPPCMQLSPLLNRLATRRHDLAVLKLDLGTLTANTDKGAVRAINWNSPHAAKYDIHSIPFLTIYGENGTKLSEGEEAFKTVISWMRDAGLVID